MMMGSSLSARLWRRPRVGLEILITMLPMLTFLTLISTWSWTLIKRYWCWRRRWRRGYNYVVLNYITNVECLSIRWFTFTGTPEGEECVSTQAGDKNKDCNSETPIVFRGDNLWNIFNLFQRGWISKERHRFRFTVEASTTSVSINLKASFQALVCRCLVMVILVQGTDRCVLVFVTGAEASGIGRCRCLLPGDYTLCCKHIRVLYVNTDII